ncbi:MAG: proton-conducting transporter membrane subunit, partial [Eubacteriales bacterium]
MILPLVLSVVFGLMIATKQFQSDSQLAKFSEWVSLILSLVGGWVLYTFYGQHLTVLNLGTNMGLRFTVDGLAVVFGGMVCLLWPIATHYAKTYMKHEGKFRRFFSFYILTFGVVLGLALSDNLFTLYLFYELLTIVTLPLVVHNERSRDFYAGRKYVAYMIFGAALTFSGMMLFISNVDTFQFTLGGTTPDILSAQLQWGYVLMFCGFGVKAGLFPFHGWLLAAGVAPTTVSSLLHAVAVVKSGAFAIMRVTFYLYDPEVLATTIVQP